MLPRDGNAITNPITSVIINRIKDEEESKSASALFSSEVLRSAIKMAFLHSDKYRHVILLTKDKKSQKMAQDSKIFSTDLAGLQRFFHLQEQLKLEPDT